MAVHIQRGNTQKSKTSRSYALTKPETEKISLERKNARRFHGGHLFMVFAYFARSASFSYFFLAFSSDLAKSSFALSGKDCARRA